jgi:TRAP transporter TAXI family solute receptor
VAFVGRLEDRPESFTQLRGIAVLQSTLLYLLVGQNSDIRRVDQLRGRRVGIGPANTATRVIGEMVLKTFGVEPHAIEQMRVSRDEAATKLSSGEVDAVFVSGDIPTKSVHDATSDGARLVSIEGPGIDRLRASNPFLRPGRILGGTYPGHRDVVRTISVDMLLVCRRDLDDQLVFDLTEQFHEILPRLVPCEGSLSLVDLKQAPATPIPLHPGAARYYRERALHRWKSTSIFSMQPQSGQQCAADSGS